MAAGHVGRWIRTGLWALPAYALLTVWATLEAQPDQTTDTEAWARFVASPEYVTSHTFGTIGGAVLAILGTMALGALLAAGRSGRVALWGTVLTVVGQALGLVIGGVSAYATPAIGRAYLAGNTEIMSLTFPDQMTLVLVLALGTMLIGNVLLGVAVARSGRAPAWAGLAWLLATVLFYVLGAVLGMATTGGSLATQPIAAGLMAVAGAAIAASAVRPPAATAP